MHNNTLNMILPHYPLASSILLWKCSVGAKHSKYIQYDA